MKTTPKDFFLWAGAMLALYASVVSFLTLMFQYINTAFPDVLEYTYYSDPYSGPMRFAVASLVIFFPAFLLLMRLIRKEIAKEPAKQDLWVRRWALHLTIFIAGITIAIDLVTLVNAYLGGEVTMRFLMKVLIVLLVAVGGFMHFLADLRGYWTANPKKAGMIALGSLLVVIASLVSGLFIMGTPDQVRLYRLDAEKISDLQTIQYQVRDYWQSKQQLPETLDDLTDPLSNYRVNTTDPQSGEEYGYRILEGTMPHFELCATFNAESRLASDARLPKMEEDSWWHEAGEVCFTRTIDPDRYPPYTKGIEPVIVR